MTNSADSSFPLDMLERLLHVAKSSFSLAPVAVYTKYYKWTQPLEHGCRLRWYLCVLSALFDVNYVLS